MWSVSPGRDVGEAREMCNLSSAPDRIYTKRGAECGAQHNTGPHAGTHMRRGHGAVRTARATRNTRRVTQLSARTEGRVWDAGSRVERRRMDRSGAAKKLNARHGARRGMVYGQWRLHSVVALSRGECKSRRSKRRHPRSTRILAHGGNCDEPTCAYHRTYAHPHKGGRDARQASTYRPPRRHRTRMTGKASFHNALDTWRCEGRVGSTLGLRPSAQVNSRTEKTQKRWHVSAILSSRPFSGRQARTYKQAEEGIRSIIARATSEHRGDQADEQDRGREEKRDDVRGGAAPGTTRLVSELN
ncbi:hypothetical protein FB451DRAFT_1360092 [Mycena latifolia]|nr:hypothetical protein FB451DRAFT_1360092 [Mycena latifolia]